MNIEKLISAKQNIMYKCPRGHLISCKIKAFFIAKTELNIKFFQGSNLQFGDYYRCPECACSHFEDEWEQVEINYNVAYEF